VLVGVSHEHAPVALRERLHVDPEVAREQLLRLAREGDEAAVLCTCNRTEIYLAATDVERATRRALDELRGLTGVRESELRRAVSILADRDAAAHLFSVAGGIESMVCGDTQILGQVREAHRIALEAGTSGLLLDRLFRHAVQAGRRIRMETTLAERPASVPSATAQLAEQVFGSLERCSVLVVGAGRMSELAILELVHRRAGRIVVANRRLERLERLARRFGVEAIALDRLEQELAKADVVISTTSARKPVLSLEQARRAVGLRRGRPILLVDIAVPRDLDPQIASLDGCYLYDIDDVSRIVAAGLGGRESEVARAREIADGEAGRFRSWQLSLGVVPAIAALRRRADAIRTAELTRAERKLATLTPRERRLVESLTAQIVNKFLHEPTIRMKAAAGGPAGLAYAGVVQRLFEPGEGSP
jgi:glutamyl-tRNA reductase